MTKTQKTVSPIDGSLYVERDFANAGQIRAALEKAQTAQIPWRETSLDERKILCAKATRAFVANKDRIAEELCWQMGRPIRYAAGEVTSFAARANHMISVASAALAQIEVTDKPGFIRYISHEPVGVVLVIAPWNFPLHTPINVIIPALLAGNSVILKHSPQTPLCAERIHEAFQSAGLPDGLFQFLHMTDETTETMIKSAPINFVAFTGSVPVGAKVEKAAAGRFIGVGLELGGKDPCYVRADADLDHAVENTVDGAFFNSGQSCCAIERLYVHQDCYDAYLEKFIALVKKYQLGRPDDPNTTLGPLVSAASAAFVRGQIKAAVAQGALPHIDVNDFSADQEGSPYMAPQVLSNVNHTMRLMTEESFGPVVGIMKVASDEEAVKLMNDSAFGLTASIFTKDIDRATLLGQQIETGTLFVNRCDFLDPELAWTGIKNSGRGCSLSILGFAAVTRPKSFHIKTIL